MSWAPNTEPDLDGYHVYKEYETSSGTHTYVDFTTNTTYVDNDFTAGRPVQDRVTYWVKALDTQGKESDPTGQYAFVGTSILQWEKQVTKETTTLTLPTQLLPNAPNPFNPTTVFHFTVQEASPVTITVYDVRGRLVETVVQQQFSAGAHQVRFDGRELPGGMYLYRMETPSTVQTGKMILLK